MAQPAENAAIVRPRTEPEKIQEDATRAEKASLPEQRPRVSLLPSDANAITASPRPEPAKSQNGQTLIAIPSLPGRSPFRYTPFKSEIVEEPAAFRQQAPEQAPAKGSVASRFLANLWPGNKGEATPVSSTAEASPSPAGDGKAGQAEAAPTNNNPPIKRFLNGIQFWKN